MLPQIIALDECCSSLLFEMEMLSLPSLIGSDCFFHPFM
jgi:hypothetical protein